MQTFNSILVANRGEIAVRVLRTAHEMGLHTIAVHSTADTGAPHVRMADDAVCIGPGPAAQSYLDIDRILQAARDTGAEAIHPGYGFLSENAAFAKACTDANLVFIGPDAQAIALMGDKAAAKTRMIAAGVPCVPGYEGADQSDAAMIAAAEDIGFPIMVKASAGGGGRGMRLVASPDGLPGALEAARSEAMNAFGSDHLILERAVQKPRHVEIQVFADAHGTVLHLGERDCSVQRRHQKVVEEAPCPVMTGDLRDRMGAAAVEAARNIDYRGAGTVEFLLDADGSFYFLEMNTRLQVEHPVTEMITGLDLVALQIAVADGRPLGLTQADVALRGHAIEVRLYAEDPAKKFLPRTGVIDTWQPATGPGIRIDSGIASGQEISPFYDPMIAKVIAWGDTRESARIRLIQALQDTALFGLKTNRAFLIDILQRPVFAAGAATTAFIEEEFSPEDLAETPAGPDHCAIAAVLTYLHDREAAFARAIAVPRALLNWSSGDAMSSDYTLAAGKQERAVTVLPTGTEQYTVRMPDHECQIDVRTLEPGRARLRVNGHPRKITFAHLPKQRIEICEAGRTFAFQTKTPGAATEAASGQDGRVTAPMHGVLLEVLVATGDKVTRGDRLAVLEAMKMQHDLKAEASGTIGGVPVSAGDQVAAGTLLIQIEPTSKGK